MRALALAALVLPGCSLLVDLDDVRPGATDAAGVPDARADAPPDPTDASAGADAAAPRDGTTAADAAPIPNEFVAVADTWLDTTAPTVRYGAAPVLQTQREGPTASVALIRFDVSALAGTTITSATLVLEVEDGDSQSVDVYDLTESWSEPNATWNERTTGTAWSGAGATPPSRGAMSMGAALLRLGSSSIPLQPALVAGWAETPSSNYGAAVVAQDAKPIPITFSSRETSTGVAPRLLVTHVP